MQNFKQYLKENTETLNTTFFYEYKGEIFPNDEKSIKKDTFEKYSNICSDVEIEMWEYNYMLVTLKEVKNYITLTDSNLVNEINDFIYKIISNCCKQLVYLKKGENEDSTLNHIPSKPIPELKTEIVLGEDIKNLKGINNIFPNVNVINFEDASLIENGVIYLMKIKSLSLLICKEYSQSKWMLIINKHLKGDRDIVECAEELIENNQKHFM